MRTNLKRPATATALPSRARPHAPASLAVHAFGSVVIAASALIVLSQQARASDLFATHPMAGVCHKVDEVNATLFPKQQIAAYDFKGDDAGKLKLVMDSVSYENGPAALLVRVVLVPQMDEAWAFQFGPDGCQTSTVALDFRGMATVFESAGVNAPFGATFYQLTGQAI